MLVRKQRVKVPLRLVVSAHYTDAALPVYVKVAALAARPEGCEARVETIASYVNVSKSTAERGLSQLTQPDPDGVVELMSRRRTLTGGRGQSALRRPRPLGVREAYVWLPVAAAEDLTPRQLRVYAMIAYAQVQKIPLTEGELASGLRHHYGKRAGQPLSVTAASDVVDELEAMGWITVDRRSGMRGRNWYVAHDLPPEEREVPQEAVPDPPEVATREGELGASAARVSSQVGDGSGSQVGDGSLAYKERPKIDSPDDGPPLLSPAVGEAKLGKLAAVAENVASELADAAPPEDLALRAGGSPQPPPTKPDSRDRRSPDRSPPPSPTGSRSGSRTGNGAPPRPSYGGPALTMSALIYAVLEPVHYLLKQVNPFMARRIAREVGRQLREDTTPERLHHRLTFRYAQVMNSDIRDPARWLLGVALPRWGCGLTDCEAGILWTSGATCEICAEIVQDKARARQREERRAQGLCPEHGTRPNPSGRCRDCELDQLLAGRAPLPTSATPWSNAPPGPPRGTCHDCGARIMVTGPAVEDGLCKPCREERAETGPPSPTCTA
ncbi:hypothetical protein ACFQLX_14800 [Streptomyces polyrhachis]|uniref:Helix-turn-helix domain-containing protein n=1 Tax=Streptomyces polyrhachis TaxID=1282885 RepID=A0ABW2GFA5_9ACTN